LTLTSCDGDPGRRFGRRWSTHAICGTVFLVQRERVITARRVERPAVQPMGRDDRVGYDGYAAQDPANVARQLGDAARLFANVLDRLGDDDWERTVLYGYPRDADVRRSGSTRAPSWPGRFPGTASIR
jgi:hypothetical protein